MAENDMYVAAFNDIFRAEFIKCVDVMDMIVALGTLTMSDEENVRAVYKTEGNTSAAICLCERLYRKPNWKENIVNALKSDDIGQGDLADRIEEKFKEVKAVNKISVNHRLDDETHTSFYNRLKENIRLSNMYIRKNVCGDGNCFLYCIQDQFERLGLPNRSSKQLRADLVNYLQNLDKEDPLTSLIDDNYLNNLSKDGTFVDEIAVRGMSRILNHNFYIVTSQRGSTEQGYRGTKIQENFNPEGLMLFGQIGELHYISLGITNPLPFDQNCDLSNANQSLLPPSPQAMVNINVNVYNGARQKETSQVAVDKSPTSDSAVSGIRPKSNVSNAEPTFPEKNINNIFQLTKYEEQLVGDALDGKQKNVLIISPDEDESRSRIPAHICISHLQNAQSGNGVKKLKVVCLASTNRLGWLSNFGKYLSSFRIYTILNDQKNTTAESMEEYGVILSTAENFERALTSKVLAFSDITLLILYECHLSCQRGHPYRSIMKSYLTEKLAANLALQVVGLTTSGNIQGQGDMIETEDNLSNLIGMLDAMCVSMVTEEATINELYSQVYPKVALLSISTRRQDDPFCRVISGMMLEIEQKLELNVEPLQHHSEHYGNHIAELSKQEENQKKGDQEENGRVALLKHLAVYNKVLQINEILRTKDALALLKKLYKEIGDDDEWLENLYQEHSSQLYKLSKEGDSKYENPRLAHLKREILKTGGDFKAIIISENCHVLEALHDWLSSSPDFKNLHTQLLSTNDKSSEIESFNSGKRRILLTSSAGLKGSKLHGVTMAVIFISVMDGIRICQSDEDVPQELLGLIAQLQFTEVVKHVQDLPEEVKRKNNLQKKLQILRESGVLEEQYISPNLSESMRVEEFDVVKGLSGKRCLLDTNVRGQASDEGEHNTNEPVKSPLTLHNGQIGEENEGGKNLPCKGVDKNVGIQGKIQLSEYKLYCRGSPGNGKCTADEGTFACSLSDVRLMRPFNHVYKKIYWNWLSKINVKEHRDKSKRKFGMKKIYCKVCGANWGNTFKLYPCLKLTNFNVKFPNGELKYFSQWKKLDFPIPPMEEDQ